MDWLSDFSRWPEQPCQMPPPEPLVQILNSFFTELFLLPKLHKRFYPAKQYRASRVLELFLKCPYQNCTKGRQTFRWEYIFSRVMGFPTMWYVRPAKPQIRAVWSEPLLVAWIFHECLATDWTWFGVSKLKRRLHRLVWVYTCQNATMLESTCHGSNVFKQHLLNNWFKFKIIAQIISSCCPLPKLQDF